MSLACCWLCSSLFTGSRVPSLAVLFTGSRVPSLAVLFTGSRVPSLAVLFTGSRVPSLAVSLSSRPFGSCFIQPTIHSLGLKDCVVHDRFIRRRSGHRTNNLLNTLTSDEPPRHDRHACGRPHTLELEGVPTIYSHSLNSSAPADSRCRDSFKIAASSPRSGLLHESPVFTRCVRHQLSLLNTTRSSLTRINSATRSTSRPSSREATGLAKHRVPPPRHVSVLARHHT